MNKNKGFTLIELLVVIAIIGILSSVVLASLSSARDKGKDAAVKSQLSSMRTQSELFVASTFDNPEFICTKTLTLNGFGGTSGPGLLKATPDSAAMANIIATVVTSAGAYDQVTCHDSVTAWAVEAPMSDSTPTIPSMYCVDSIGSSIEKNTVFKAGDVSCK